MAAAGMQQLQVKLRDPLHPQAAPQGAHNVPLAITAAEAGKPEPALCWVEGPGLCGSSTDGTGGPDKLQAILEVIHLVSYKHCLFVFFGGGQHCFQGSGLRVGPP